MLEPPSFLLNQRSQPPCEDCYIEVTLQSYKQSDSSSKDLQYFIHYHSNPTYLKAAVVDERALHFILHYFQFPYVSVFVRCAD